MSLKELASRVQSHGRNGDSMLIHMTPKEVGGLQSLAQAHGGSLTINPETGLPEANFLEAILPTVLGVGIMAATGGAAAPWMVGAGVGGGTALLTGDINKGLMAGLGAAGGAGLGGSLAGMGAAAPASAASAMGVPGAATGAGSQAAMLAEQAAGFGTAGLENIASSAGYAAGATPAVPGTGSLMASGAQQAFNAPMEFAKNNAMNLGMAAAPILGSAYNQSDVEEPEAEGNIRQFDYSQEVNPNFGQPGQPYFTQSYTPGPVTPAASFTGFSDGGIAQIPNKYQQPTRRVDPAVANYNQQLMQRAQQEYNQSPQLGAFRSALPSQGNYDPQAGAAFQKAQAERAKQMKGTEFGYQFDSATNRIMQAKPTENEFAKLQKQIEQIQSQQPSPNDYYGNDDDPGGFAIGGIMRLARGGYTLGGYSDGGRLLKGPGDGVSDDIPATIEDRQPARLADGEFVIPARIVSEIGNGSTDAGAKRLYAMMDKVQRKRAKTTGKDRVAVDTKAYRELPA